MADLVSSQLTPPADAVAEMLAEMQRLNEQMQRDEAHIDRLKAETQAIKEEEACYQAKTEQVKAETERLRQEGEALHAETRIILDRLKANDVPRFGERTMTQLLEKAYSQVTQLPDNEQDAIAALILEALADEQQWREQFARSQDALAKLAQEALAEHRAGKTLPLDPSA